MHLLQQVFDIQTNSYWNEIIKDNLSARFHQVPPEMLNDYAEGIRRAASELVR
jgi:hypothetical protein